MTCQLQMVALHYTQDPGIGGESFPPLAGSLRFVGSVLLLLLGTRLGKVLDLPAAVTGRGTF